MNDFVDFYDLLEINRKATNDEIQVAVKTVRKTWRKRVDNSPRQSERHKAEAKMSQIAEAEKTLLDSELRSEYDRLLQVEEKRAASEQSGNQTSSSQSSSSQTLKYKLQVATEYFEKKEFEFAHIKSTEVTFADQDNYEAWIIRGSSAYKLGKSKDALYSLNEALRLRPSSAPAHSAVSDVYSSLDDFPKCLSHAERAFDIESTPRYRAGLANAQVESGKISEGLKNIELAVEESGNDEDFIAYHMSILFFAYLHQISYDTVKGDYLVTNISQVILGFRILRKMKEMTSKITGDKTDAADIIKQQKSFMKNETRLRWRRGKTWAYFIPPILGFLVSLISSQAMNSYIPLVIMGFFPVFVIYWFRHFKPQYVVNRKTTSKKTIKSGIQLFQPGIL